MPNIKFIVVKGGSGYCSERLSIGVFVKNNVVTLIDSGIDDSTAKAVDKMLKENGFQLGAIINTHSHADHCGGNSYFQKLYPDLKIYSSKYEQHYIEETVNEPRCFCQGAHPHAGLRNKFLEAKNSQVTNVIHPYIDQPVEINGQVFRIVTLPGHSPGMIGVISPDNVFYAGDAIFGRDTFEKHGVLFYTNIEDTLKSFSKMAMLDIDACVFYHGGLLEGGLKAVLAQHEARILSTQEDVFRLISAEPVSLDKLTQLVIQHYKIPQNIMQFTLTQVCVQAYVSHLEAQKKVTIMMREGLMVIGNKDVSVAKLEQAAASQNKQLEKQGNAPKITM